MLRRALIAIVAGLVCGCAAMPAGFGPSTGTVTGHVMVRACGGAYRIDQTGCRVSAVSGAQLTFLLGGGQRRTVSTDGNGAYRVDMSPATYDVRLTAAGSTRGFAGPSQVTVTAGKTVTADFTYTIELL